MARYHASALAKKLRKRIGLERKQILKFNNLDETSLSRIENERQNPKMETLENILKSISLPMEGFFYSLLDDQPPEVYFLCDRLSQVLEIGDCALAEPLLLQLEALPGFDTGVLLQFILSKKARLWELQEKPSELIFDLIKDGMLETFENFDENKMDNKVFILEEPELLHTKARVLANEGDHAAAIRIIESIISGLIDLPRANRDKERQYAPLLLSLSSFLIHTGEYDRALEACELGAEYSAIRKHGQLNPEFELNKAYALHGLNRLDECRASLQHAYFGNMLLRESEKAKEIITRARVCFGIEFDLYGANKLNFEHQPKIPSNRGSPVICNSFGTMIGISRTKLNLSLEQLSRGICNKTTLMRIEQNEVQGSIFTLETIMQRLGRDMNLYNNYFLSKEDFIAIQLRDEINVQFDKRDFENAKIILDVLETMKAFLLHNVNVQFVKMAKALLFASNHTEPHPEFLNMLVDALKLTCPDFNECDIEEYYLTFNEIALINQYAAYFGDTGDPSRASKIYGQLYRNVVGKYNDEVEAARVYSIVMFNYSMSLGREGRYDEALSVINEAENFERNRGRLIELPGFAFNKAYVLFMLNKGIDSTPYYAMAYYGTSMFSQFGQEDYLSIIRATVENHLGHVFY